MKESNLTAATQHMSNRFTDGRWEHDPKNLVETTGVEPVVPFGRRIYSPLGLPIFLHLQNTTESAFFH